MLENINTEEERDWGGVSILTRESKKAKEVTIARGCRMDPESKSKENSRVCGLGENIAFALTVKSERW